MIAQVTESLAQPAPNRRRVEGGIVRVPGRPPGNRESGRGLMTGARARRELSEGDRRGDRGEELPAAEHEGLIGYGSA
jgi:hypothetical protein